MKKDIFITRVTSNDLTMKIISWLINDKEFVNIGQSILTVETSKVNVEIVSEFSGYICQHYNEGDVLDINSCVASIYDNLEEIITDKKKIISQSNNYDSKFSNSAKRYIKENNLDPNDFLDMGLITEEKIKDKLSKKNQIQNDSCFDKAIFPHGVIEPISFSKLSEISILNQTKENSITSSLTIQFSSGEIRKSLSKFAWINGRVSTYILYVLSSMLPNYPKFMAYFKDNQIYSYNAVNLGIAIDLEKGLKVAVIKNSNTLNMFDLHMSIIDCIASYYEGNFTSSLFSHSTITTTDLSFNDIFHFQPILNVGQSVIIGIGGDQSLSGAPMTITAVFDHRILSGQEVSLFLRKFKEKLLKDHLSLEEIC